MGGRQFAVIVGVDHCAEPGLSRLRFAEADAREVADVLTDPQTGTFDPQDVRLLIGKAATSVDLKAALRGIALESDASDLLFVYFAGHAVPPGWGDVADAYLGTTDLNLDDLRMAPDQGVRLSFLRKDVFGIFPGTSLLVLDCCQAGSYVPPPESSYVVANNRHNALLSCRPGEVARELADLGHGVFTDALLRGLRGGAAGANGQVTFSGVAKFIAEQDLRPEPGEFTQTWGPSAVLTRPGSGSLLATAPMSQPARPVPEMVPCANPLQDSTGSILQLLERAFTTGGRQRPTALDRVSRAADTKLAAVVQLDPDKVLLRESTDAFDLDTYRGLLLLVTRDQVYSRHAALGYVTAQDDRRLMIVPLSHDNDSRVTALVLVDPAPALLDVGEPAATLLRALYETEPDDDPVHAEIGVLTTLRRYTGRLPLDLYTYCFGLYQQALESILMVFEPVVGLSTKANLIGVHSYEALARRDATSVGAPYKLLNVPDVWGDQFLIERDSVLAVKAIHGYADANSSGGTPRPLSINVAVRALLSDAYAAKLREAIIESGMGPHTITLEISERDPIEPADGEVWPHNHNEYFRARLTELARKDRLGVNFAVDDFGVGHASLDRLSALSLTQIKVDRSILHHQLALDELKLVVQFAEHAMRSGTAPSRVVVVEGFDEDSPVSLKDIYGLGIHYVQGYITGKRASSSLHPLTPEVCDSIARLVKGQK